MEVGKTRGRSLTGSGGTLRHAEIGNELNPAHFSAGNAWKIEMDRDVLNGASKMQQS
jgi:hypothetical protein